MLPERLNVVVAVALLASACTSGLGVPSPSADLAPSPTKPPPGSIVDMAEPPFDIWRPPVRPETCNGVDDDQDGVIDEGCPRTVPAPASSAPIISAYQTGDTIIINTKDGVYAQDGIDGTPELVAAGVTASQAAGDWILYSGPAASGNPEDGGLMYVRNLKTGEVLSVVTPPHYQNRWETLSANWVAWSQQINYDGQDSNVYAMDLATGTQYTLADDVNDSMRPLIDGDKLYYLDDRGRWTLSGWPYFDAYRYDAAVVTMPPKAKNERSYVTALSDDQGYLDSWTFFEAGGYVYRNRLHGCALERVGGPSATSILLYDHPASGCDFVAAVGERWLVVRRDDGQGAEFLRLYDLHTLKKTAPDQAALEESRALTTYPTYATMISLAGDRLMWVDFRDGGPHWWAMDLSQVDSGDFHPEEQ